MNDPEVLSQNWAEHFEKIATSREEDLEVLKAKVDGLYSSSLENEEYLVDVPFTVEEVAVAVCRLKGGKAAGPNGLMAEHLKFVGESAIIWLTTL